MDHKASVIEEAEQESCDVPSSSAGIHGLPLCSSLACVRACRRRQLCLLRFPSVAVVVLVGVAVAVAVGVAVVAAGVGAAAAVK